MTPSASNSPDSRLLLAMRVASQRIEELEAKCRAYEAVISSFEERTRVSRWDIREQSGWKWTALVAVVIAYIIFKLYALWD